MAADPRHLFVYGTLLPERAPPSLRPILARFHLRARGRVPGRLYDLGPYPGAVPDETSSDEIVGQVYALPDPPPSLADLDAYEGYDPQDVTGSLFVRRPCRATLDTGESVSCWVYAYNRDPGGLPLVPGGAYPPPRGRRPDPPPPADPDARA